MSSVLLRSVFLRVALLPAAAAGFAPQLVFIVPAVAAGFAPQLDFVVPSYSCTFVPLLCCTFVPLWFCALSPSQLELDTSISFSAFSFLGVAPQSLSFSISSSSSNCIVLLGGRHALSQLLRCQMTWRLRQPSLSCLLVQQQVKWQPSAPHLRCRSVTSPAVMGDQSSCFDSL